LKHATVKYTLAVLGSVVSIGTASMIASNQWSRTDYLDSSNPIAITLPNTIDVFTNISPDVEELKNKDAPLEKEKDKTSNAQQPNVELPAPVNPSDKLSYIWSELTKVMSDEAAAGVMGNLQAEHGFKTDDTPNGLGMVQWTGGRKTLAQTLAQQFGMLLNSVEFQVKYILMELGGDAGNGVSNQYRSDATHVANYANAIGAASRIAGRTLPTSVIMDANSFKSCNDVDLAAMSWMCLYERPSSSIKADGTPVCHADVRANAAQSIYQTYHR